MGMNRIGALQLLLMSVCISGAATAGPVLEFATANQATFGTFTGGVGWSFSTNQAITVVALDTWKLAAGDTSAVTVRLYDASLNILASALVGPSDPLTGSPAQFYSHTITPVLLAAGTTYYIAQDVSPVAIQVTGLTTDPAITYLGGLRSAATVTPLTDALGGAFSPAYFGPNFEIQSVPEPGTLGTAAAALAGLALALRRRK